MRRVFNEYLLIFANNQSRSCIAQSMTDAVTGYDSSALPLVQVTRKKVGIEAEIDSPATIAFTTSVTPAEAVTAGCRATPEAFTVPLGASVVFTALPATGFNFSGWYRDNLLVSTDLVVSISVYNSIISGQAAVFEARFVAA